MKRSTRFSHGSMWLGIATALGTLSVGYAVAQQPNGNNPLRPASKPVAKAVYTAAAVGTAVRQVEKRTPDLAVQPERSVVAERPERSVMSERPQRAVISERPQRAVISERPRPRTSPVTPAAYRRRIGHPASSVSPANESSLGSNVLNGTVTVQQGPEEMFDTGMHYEHGSEPMIGDFEPGDGHGDCCNSDSNCYQCCIPCPKIPWDDLTIFGGVQGFTGPKNLGQDGSFGFHEGINWGAPFPCSNGCLGMQLGARFTQANLSGAGFTSETRTQAFVTGGLFRRVDCGLQYGVVVDYMSDDWYTNTDLTQLRAEVAWVFPCGHELGFWMTQSLEDDTAVATIFTNQIPANVNATWESTDLYAFFYRHQFSGWEGANGRLFAGFTGESDGLIGSDFQIPLSCNVALQAGFAYLIPEESKGPAGAGNVQESWNVGISLVWYPGCGTSACKSYFAPLFNVADNGSFMVDQVQ